MNRIIKCFLMLVTLLAARQGFSQLQLPAIFSDNMVLQQHGKAAVWGQATPDRTVKVTGSWDPHGVVTKTNAAGQWKLFLETPQAGGPYTLTIEEGKNKKTFKNVLIGEVWLCSGQSNMEMRMNGYNNQPIMDANKHLLNADNQNIRLYTVQKASSGKPLSDCKGSWKASDAAVAGNFSAVAWLYAHILQQKLKIPVGIILSCWGGTRIQTWMSAESLEGIADSIKKKPAAMGKPDHYGYGALYNAMISPVVGYGIKGFLWYQGEANRKEYAVYPELMKRMVQDWRTRWGVDNLAFYYAQIAPYHYPDKPMDSLYQPLIREAQVKALKEIPNSGMAVTLDIGMYRYIHSPYKYEVALRLAYLALNRQYGFKGLASASPLYASHQIKEGKVYVKFKNASSGMTSYGAPITLFELAGADKKFYPASATITRADGIELWSDKVPQPVAVRYGFKDYVKGELFNNAGLPASSFRTDDWEIGY